MDNDTFRKRGFAIFETADWWFPLSKLLRVQLRTVERWARVRDPDPIPDNVATALNQINRVIQHPNNAVRSKLTAAEFSEAGKYLFTEAGWRCPLAQMLRVEPSTIREWETGETAVPDVVAGQIKTVLKVVQAKMIEARNNHGSRQIYRED